MPKIHSFYTENYDEEKVWGNTKSSRSRNMAEKKYHENYSSNPLPPPEINSSVPL